VSRSLNKVQLIGNLGADPEVRSTPNGSRVASFSLATSRQWTGTAGDKQEKTEWHKCVAWNTKGGALADLIEKYVHKGDKLFVEGRVEYRQYQDKENQTRYVTEINVRELILLGGRGGSAPDLDGGPASSTARPRAASVAPKAGGKPNDEDFGDFPGTMDEGDDDLPF
jgi:single-strand DNA-binding protein